MISAILYQGTDGLTACRITGHSGQAEAGRDIVCAAVSILGCTCVNAMESVCGLIPLITENEDGVLAFQLPEMTPEENAKAQILMGALKQGLTDLADSYPQNVTLKIETLSHE
ncbi:MAG: ribosomal-processing cysteine protease Prp [Clostridia bacterium]|nr:ribosomal-processing cysteine protease Prp [Clostridia bacterium]